MTTTISQLIIYRAATSRYHAGAITKVESGDTCTLLVLGDGIDWTDAVPAAFYARPMASITKGSGVGQWQAAELPDTIAAAIASAITSATGDYATTDYIDSSVAGLASSASVTSAIAAAVSGLASTSSVSAAISDAVAGLVSSGEMATAIAAAVAGLATTAGVTSAISAAVSGLASTAFVASSIASAIAAIPPDDYSGLCAVPAAGSPVTLALDTARQPNTSRPTRVTIYGIAAMTSTLLGAQSATVTVLADAASTPTTTVAVVGPMTLSGVVATATHAWTATYDVPTGHRYMVTAAGNASAGVSITHIEETAQ
jgi:hypothetical protein